MNKYTKDSAKEVDEDKLKGLGSVREVANNFGGIAEMGEEYFKFKKEIYR